MGTTIVLIRLNRFTSINNKGNKTSLILDTPLFPPIKGGLSGLSPRYFFSETLCFLKEIKPFRLITLIILLLNGLNEYLPTI